MHVNTAFKLTIARFINSSIILIIVQKDGSHWFDEGGLVEDATTLIVIMAAQYSIVYWLNIPGIFKKIIKCW